MLKRIHVHNFVTFVNFEWRPPPSCVLVGENGAGKSALLEVLRLLQAIVVDGRTIDDLGAVSSRTAWLGQAEQTIEVEVDYEGNHAIYRLEVHHEAGRGALREKLTSGAGEVLYQADAGRVELFGDKPTTTPRTTIPFDRRRSFLAALEERPDNTRVIAFRRALASMWLMKPDPLRLGATADEESVFLKSDMSNFASWYRKVSSEDPDAADALRADLRRALTGFVTLRFEPISPEVKDLRVRFSFGDKTHELGWRMLSDGQRLLIALFGMLRFGLRRAGFIALDECENYVAPREIQPWFQAVVDAAAEGKQQLLVVSHHPDSINYLAADAVWRLWRDRQGGHTRIARLEPDLGVGETAYDLVKQALGDEPASPSDPKS
jgi:predicted ATPase